MLRRGIPLVTQAAPILRSKLFGYPFSTSCLRRSDPSDPLPSLLEDVRSPLDITTVLRSGEGFKIRTLEEPTPFTINGNLVILDGQYFLWRPKLYSPGPGVLDIAPESWGILDVITPKPGISTTYRVDDRNRSSWDWEEDYVCTEGEGSSGQDGHAA